MKHVALLLSAGVLLCLQSDASAWSNVKFTAGVNFFYQHIPHPHCHGCRGRHCGGAPIGMPITNGGPMAYGAPMGAPMGMPMASSGPVYDGAIGQSGFAPPTMSFGQAPGAQPNFYPASYQSYSGYTPHSYGW